MRSQRPRSGRGCLRSYRPPDALTHRCHGPRRPTTYVFAVSCKKRMGARVKTVHDPMSQFIGPLVSDGRDCFASLAMTRAAAEAQYFRIRSPVHRRHEVMHMGFCGGDGVARLRRLDRRPQGCTQPAMRRVVVQPAMPDHRERHTRRYEWQRPDDQRTDCLEVRGDSPWHDGQCL